MVCIIESREETRRKKIVGNELPIKEFRNGRIWVCRICDMGCAMGGRLLRIYFKLCISQDLPPWNKG